MKYACDVIKSIIPSLSRLTFVFLALTFAATCAFGQYVQLTNNSRSGSAFYAGDYYTLTVTGQANVAVTCTIGTWTGTMGSTDGSGIYVLNGQFTSADIGVWTEYWAAGGVAVYPYPLTFYIYDAPPVSYSPTVTLSNLSRPGTVYYPGHKYVLTISNGAPYSLVTCRIESGTMNMGYTDANGTFALYGTFTSSDIGQWNEFWTVGNDAVQPSPFIFAVTSPSGVTTITDVLFDSVRWVVRGFSSTDIDYGTAGYYLPQTETAILENGTEMARAIGTYGGYAYGVSVEVVAQSGRQYKAISDTYLLAISYVYVPYMGGYYYDDYYGYSLVEKPYPDNYEISIEVWGPPLIGVFVTVQRMYSGGTGSQSVTVPYCTLTITNPPGDQLYHLGGSNYNQVDIPIAVSGNACTGAQAAWTIVYNYTNSSGVTYSKVDTAYTRVGQQAIYTARSGGGQIGLSVAAVGSTATKVVYVDGPPNGIPNGTISCRLLKLYSGTTPDLLTRIARKESSYAQYKTMLLMGVGGKWPIENFQTYNKDGSVKVPAGTYIGLMQVPNSMDFAFDWWDNTQKGADTLGEKITSTVNYVANRKKTNTGLPDLSPIQLEDTALGRYGGYADWLFVPNSAGDGWVLNNQAAQEYADKVRAQPGGVCQ